MSTSKHILLFGAGKSATVLIDYLKNVCTENGWSFTVADSNLELAASKTSGSLCANAVQVNIEDGVQRSEQIKKADLVISMMPAFLHSLVAGDCIEYGKHLFTASYVDEGIKTFEEKIKERNLLFLCEMGLDPGIDHMSAMQIFHRIENEGGIVNSFKSHCGGLVAPESDDNPWHYKISWNPRNIILAGKAGAVYKENDEEKHLPYEELFSPDRLVNVPGDTVYAYYPNRDSLSYAPLYGLQQAHTFVRTTLRHPDFCFGWKNIVDLKLTDEEKIYNTDGMTVEEFFHQHLEKHNFRYWLEDMLKTRFEYAKEMMENISQLLEAEEEMEAEDIERPSDFMMVDDSGNLAEINVEDVKSDAAGAVAQKLHEANLCMKQLFFLGLDDETLINKGLCSAADVLQFIAERKLALQPDDKDMIVMLHEIGYTKGDTQHEIKSSLIVKGEDSLHTAMAKTVGLPLGIAAKLFLEGKLNERGLHIPIIPSIYEPVLEELKKHDIEFIETEE